ncbi:MAG: IS630 family transposase [Acidovorax sp.]
MEDAPPLGLESEKKTFRASEQSHPDIKKERSDWVGAQPRLEPARLIFLDETSITTNMTPAYGRSPRGTRCLGQAPFGQRQSSTLVCALQTQGLIAPMVFDGPINGSAFVAWVKQALAPELKAGDIVVMDNLSSHKVAGVRQAIEACNAQVLYLPPYSPEFNPIEQVFAKLKTLLRKAQARTSEALLSAVATLISALTPANVKTTSAIPAIVGQGENALFCSSALHGRGTERACTRKGLVIIWSV